MTKADFIGTRILTIDGDNMTIRKKLDAEVVEDAMMHIIGGNYTAYDPEGYADSGENPAEVFERQVCKHCYAVRRDRKIADNRKHYEKLCEKREEQEYE